jgi:hypothetical protein
MNLNKFLLKNTDGKESVTMTAFVLGFLIVNLKLILSGITIEGLTIPPFSGSDYAMAIGALGAVYVMRRQGEKNDNITDEE